MAASADDLRKAIAPGSVEHGQRDDLEAGLSGALGSSPGVGPGGPPQPGMPQSAAGSPLDALLGGQITPPQGNDLPLTAGLSVGPGAGPAGLPGQDPRKAKLQQMATTARSPVLRQVARNELRRLVREKK